MNHKMKWAILIASALLMTSCAGMTAAETGGVIAAGAGALVGIVESLSPYLPPEKIAELSGAVANAEGVIGAIQAGVAAVAEAAAQNREAVAAAQATADGGISGETLAVGGTAAAAAGTVASRVLSIMKHGTPPKKA